MDVSIVCHFGLRQLLTGNKV